MLDLPTLAKTFVGLLAIVDPFVTVPLFLGLTLGMSVDERKHIAKVAGFSVFVILTVAMLAGMAILNTLGISLAAFRVAGGAILLMTAIASFQAEPGKVRQNPIEEAESHERAGIAIVPLATPLLAGPGAISWVIVNGGESQSWWQSGALIFIIAAVGLITFVALSAGSRIATLLGRTGMNVATRIGGLLTAALAIEIMAKGLIGLFPVLAK